MVASMLYLQENLWLQACYIYRRICGCKHVNMLATTNSPQPQILHKCFQFPLTSPFLIIMKPESPKLEANSFLLARTTTEAVDEPAGPGHNREGTCDMPCSTLPLTSTSHADHQEVSTIQSLCSFQFTNQFQRPLCNRPAEKLISSSSSQAPASPSPHHALNA